MGRVCSHWVSNNLHCCNTCHLDVGLIFSFLLLNILSVSSSHVKHIDVDVMALSRNITVCILFWCIFLTALAFSNS